jgi:hypothetical protein
MALGFLGAALGAGQAIMGAIGLKKAKKAADAAIQGIETQEVDPLVAARYNMPMPGEEQAKQDIGQTLTQSLGAAKTRKGGLQSVTGAVTQANKAKQGLATERAKYKLGAEQNLVGQREKAFKSRQEKQQLMANIALQDVASQRQMISQGISGIGSGLYAGAMSGEGNPLSGLGKGLLGMFGKKKSLGITPPTSYDESTTENTWG